MTLKKFALYYSTGFEFSVLISIIVFMVHGNLKTFGVSYGFLLSLVLLFIIYRCMLSILAMIGFIRQAYGIVIMIFCFLILVFLVGDLYGENHFPFWGISKITCEILCIPLFISGLIHHLLVNMLDEDQKNFTILWKIYTHFRN